MTGVLHSQKASQLAVVVTEGIPLIRYRTRSQKASQLAVVVTADGLSDSVGIHSRLCLVIHEGWGVRVPC